MIATIRRHCLPGRAGSNPAYSPGTSIERLTIAAPSITTPSQISMCPLIIAAPPIRQFLPMRVLPADIKGGDHLSLGDPVYFFEDGHLSVSLEG